jgi:sigma-B regulation protein RsbU (phosphoserine phosphatase)
MEDLKLAAMVHYSFLPEDYEDERIIVASTLRPLYTIGGDFCSIIPLDEDHLLVCTCDAVGHGVSAALFAARINTYVLTHAYIETPPCELVSGLNAHLCKRLEGSGMYSSFYAVLIDFKEETITFAGAAHPPVLHLCPETNKCLKWPSSVTYLGIDDPMLLNCNSESIKMISGQRFLLYSDGLIEAENADQEQFGVEGLSSLLDKNKSLAGQELNNVILSNTESFTENGFSDDVLLISITLK